MGQGRRQVMCWLAWSVVRRAMMSVRLPAVGGPGEVDDDPFGRRSPSGSNKDKGTSSNNRNRLMMSIWKLSSRKPWFQVVERRGVGVLASLLLLLFCCSRQSRPPHLET